MPRLYDALMTSCKNTWPPSVYSVPRRRRRAASCWKTHCVLLSSSVDETQLASSPMRSNQRCTHRVIGEAHRLRRFENTGSTLHKLSAGNNSGKCPVAPRRKIVVRRLHRAVFALDAFDAAVCEKEKAWRTPARRWTSSPPCCGKRALRHPSYNSPSGTQRDAEAVKPLRASKETLSRKRRARSARRLAIEFFIERADEDDFPEAADRPPQARLAMLLGATRAS